MCNSKQQTPLEYARANKSNSDYITLLKKYSGGCDKPLKSILKKSKQQFFDVHEILPY